LDLENDGIRQIFFLYFPLFFCELFIYCQQPKNDNSQESHAASIISSPNEDRQQLAKIVTEYIVIGAKYNYALKYVTPNKKSKGGIQKTHKVTNEIIDFPLSQDIFHWLMSTDEAARKNLTEVSQV